MQYREAEGHTPRGAPETLVLTIATVTILLLTPVGARAQVAIKLGPLIVLPPSSRTVERVILGGIARATKRPTTTTRSGARVIPTAERYLGTPYRWGGTSPVTGFDCSGFVQYVFARNAVKLPRTSRQQAKVGSAMPRSFSSLAPGDLVMFAERGRPISHVAIYAGHNRIIHATSSGGEVRYDDLGTSRGKWFVQHLAAARRVTPDGRGLILNLVRLLDAKSLADTALDLGDLAPRR